MELSTVVQTCLRYLQAASAPDLPVEVEDKIQAETGRFKMWVGNMAAHRPQTSQRSLSYRLRNSPRLYGEVVVLLQELKSALHSLPNVQALDREESDRVSENEQDIANASLMIIAEGETLTPTEAVDELHEVINCLYRLSMAFKHVASHSSTRGGRSGIAKAYEPYDIQHVRDKFPNAPEFLTTRLGKAITRRRQYIAYCQSHHEKMCEDVDTDVGSDARSSTVAMCLFDAEPFASRSRSIDGEYAESHESATSFASGLSADGDHINFPSRPETENADDPFECPICFTIIVAVTEQAFRRHICEDLLPYTCTYEDRITGEQPYSNRSAWERHERTMHPSGWVCPFQCHASTSSIKRFEYHVQYYHQQELSKAAMRDLASQHVDEHAPRSTICTVCAEDLGDTKLLVKHVERHFLRLALAALPQDLISTQVEPEADSDEDQLRDNAIPRDYHSTALDYNPAMLRDSDAGTEIERRVAMSPNGSERQREVWRCPFPRCPGQRSSVSVLIRDIAVNQHHPTWICQQCWRTFETKKEWTAHETSRKRLADPSECRARCPCSSNGADEPHDFDPNTCDPSEFVRYRYLCRVADLPVLPRGMGFERNHLGQRSRRSRQKRQRKA